MIKAFIHVRWMILDLLRQPAYIVSTVAFPSLFYVIFALPESTDKLSSNMLLASFSCFAVFGVLFLQFGVGVSQERTKSWYHYLKTLPLDRYHLIAARFICAYFFSFLTILPLILISHIYTDASLSFSQWLGFSAVMILGGLVFCFMGLCLGIWTSEKSALPLGNFIYLPLSFVGGLWKPPTVLPEILKDISELLPTRHFGEIAWNIVLAKDWSWESSYILGCYTVLFLTLALISLNYDTKERVGV